MGRPGTPGPADMGRGTNTGDNKATVSGAMVLMGLVSFVMGVIAVAVPYWGHFRPGGKKELTMSGTQSSVEYFHLLLSLHRSGHEIQILVLQVLTPPRWDLAATRTRDSSVRGTSASTEPGDTPNSVLRSLSTIDWKVRHWSSKLSYLHFQSAVKCQIFMNCLHK